MGCHEQAGGHPGDGGVHSRLQGGGPERDGHQHVGRGLPDLPAAEEPEGDEAGGGNHQGHGVELLGVHRPDHAHRHDVVDHRQHEEEDPQLGRADRAHERERPEEEGGVRADDHAPAAGRLPVGREQEVEQRREEHAAEPGDQGDDDATAPGELTDRELAPHLEADHEEEQRHGAVVDPVAQVHGEPDVTDLHGHGRVPQCHVLLRQRGVGPGDGYSRGREQQARATRLGAQEGAQRAGELAQQGAPANPRLARRGFSPGTHRAIVATARARLSPEATPRRGARTSGSAGSGRCRPARPSARPRSTPRCREPPGRSARDRWR